LVSGISDKLRSSSVDVGNLGKSGSISCLFGEGSGKLLSGIINSGVRVLEGILGIGESCRIVVQTVLSIIDCFLKGCNLAVRTVNGILRIGNGTRDICNIGSDLVQ
jgi:hypothetical protein